MRLFPALLPTLCGLVALAGPAEVAAPGDGLTTDRAIEQFLLTAEVVSMRGVTSGITRPAQVTLRRDGIERRALFKTVNLQLDSKVPVGAGRTERGFTDRYQYEIAAYRLDRLLGLGMVPVTVFRNVTGSPGSLQIWVEGAMHEEERRARGLEPDDAAARERQRGLMRLFDFLIANIDRNEVNLLFSAEGSRLHLIDHSRAFRNDRRPPVKLRSIPLFAIPATVVERLRGLDRAALDAALGELLASEQIEAILTRRGDFLKRWDRRR